MKRIVVLFLVAFLFLSSITACSRQPAEITAATTATTETTAPSTAPEPTPGPTLEATAATEPPAPVAAPLVISEVMADNRNLVLGHGLDWVELYNPTETTVSLDCYTLSDSVSDPDALPLDGLTVPGGGYLTVPLTDDGALQLSEVGETVYLFCQGETVSSLTFPAAREGKSYDGLGFCTFPTPGYENTQDGYLAYLDSQPQPELIISEAMPANGSYFRQGSFFYDWVEIRNNSNADVSLKNYYLTDRWENTARYFFPDVSLAPGECYMVLCSEDPDLGPQHTAFGITPGDTLYLVRNGQPIDCLPLPGDLKHNESYGRNGSIPGYQSKPTPNAENAPGYPTGIAAPVADIAPGLYDEAVTVTLSGPGTIYYTLDGARPSTRSMVYDGPITIKNITTIRAFCSEDGRTSPVANFTYVVGKTHDLPVLVISTPDDSLWGSTGILTNVENEFEREAVMTLFEDGKEAFSTPMGLRLHGNDSRFGAKKNFQLRFRGQYGAGKLKYPLFENRDFDEFDSLLLKGGSEDWGLAMIRDELATSIADGTTALYTQAMKPVVVYLAGEYWGVHHLRERFSSEYVASHMGVSPASVDLLFSSGGYVQEGSSADFHALKSYVMSHDMRTTENFNYLCQQIDVNSLMDWYICRTYMEDTDIANIRRCRSSEGDGKWHWMYFDLDWSFYSRNKTPVSSILEINGGDKLLIHAVLASEAGRDAFLKRYAYLMNTVLNETYINQRIDEIVASMETEMERDRYRWDRTVAGWNKHIGILRKFISNRHVVVLNDIQNYFSLTDAQMEGYFGTLWE